MDKERQFADEKNEIGGVTKLLWWIATAHYPVLKNCPTDYIRTSIVGTVVVVTSLVGFASGFYFFRVLTDNVFYALICGLLFAFIIFTLDRLLIASMTKKVSLDEPNAGAGAEPAGGENSGIGAKFIVLRLFISIIIGLLYSEPLVLSFFETEIADQVEINKDAYLKERMAKHLSVDTLQIEQIKSQLNRIQTERNKYKADLDSSYKQFKNEMDGSYGSSGKRGYEKIAKQKEVRYLDLKKIHDTFVQRKQADTDTLNNQLERIRNESRNTLLKETKRLAVKKSGYLDKETALVNIMEKHHSVIYKYALLLLFFLMIDIMPLLTKLWFNAGSYEKKLFIAQKQEVGNSLSRLRLAQEKMYADERVELTDIALEEEINKKIAVKTNEHLEQMRLKTMDDFFVRLKAKNVVKIDDLIEKYGNDPQMTFDDLLKELKERLV